MLFTIKETKYEQPDLCFNFFWTRGTLGGFGFWILDFGSYLQYNMAQFSASPVALLSEASSEGGTPPSNRPPRILNKDIVFFHLGRIRMYDVTIDNASGAGGAAAEGVRTVQRVFAYKKGKAKWVYTSKAPYTFIGRLVDGHDFIRLDYNEHFGISVEPLLEQLPSPPALQQEDSESSTKSMPNKEAEEEEVCLLCAEPFEVPPQEGEIEDEIFDRLQFVIGKCGHKMCRLCWRKSSSMVVNNAAPGYPELNVLCDAVCPFCKGDIDMVSKDRENIVRQWQEDEFIDIDDDSEDSEDGEDIEDEDFQENRVAPAAAGGGAPLCTICRQPGHNRRTCPQRAVVGGRG